MSVTSKTLLTCGAVMLPLALGGCVVPADRCYRDHWNGAHQTDETYPAPPPPAYYYHPY